MKLKYFGDSYDLVKKSLIAWLSEFGSWVTHPMFTEEFKPEDAGKFSRLLETPLLSVEVLTPQTNREEYFSSCQKAGHLFLDPDTGVRLERCRGKKSRKFVFGPELVEWCDHRPKALTLIFDQSYSREFKKEILLQNKLKYFADNNIFGVAYDSHATFLLLGADPDLVKAAREKLLEVSGLPPHRLVCLDSKGEPKNGVIALSIR
ncbi:MAG TPA: hypothetical protein VIT88_00910 [Pyrinomonadaceae bacterium]